MIAVADLVTYLLAGSQDVIFFCAPSTPQGADEFFSTIRKIDCGKTFCIAALCSRQRHRTPINAALDNSLIVGVAANNRSAFLFQMQFTVISELIGSADIRHHLSGFLLTIAADFFNQNGFW